MDTGFIADLADVHVIDKVMLVTVRLRHLSPISNIQDLHKILEKCSRPACSAVNSRIKNGNKILVNISNRAKTVLASRHLILLT